MDPPVSVRAHEDPGERLGVQDQAQGGGEEELEARVPQAERVERGHQRCHEGHAVKPVLPAAELAGEQAQPAHQRRPHDRGCRAHQYGIQGDAARAQDSREHAPPGAQQPPEQSAEQARENGDIEPTDVKPISTPILC